MSPDSSTTSRARSLEPSYFLSFVNVSDIILPVSVVLGSNDFVVVNTAINICMLDTVSCNPRSDQVYGCSTPGNIPSRCHMHLF